MGQVGHLDCEHYLCWGFELVGMVPNLDGMVYYGKAAIPMGQRNFTFSLKQIVLSISILGRLKVVGINMNKL